jgi:hypothetical protein
MVKLFVLGAVLVSAHMPSIHKTYVRNPLNTGCKAENGCANLSEQQCTDLVPGGEMFESFGSSDEHCELDEKVVCLCDMRFTQPSTPSKNRDLEYGKHDGYNAGYYNEDAAGYYYGGDAGYYYGDNAGSNGKTPCGWSSMLTWDDAWDVNNMGPKNALNKDYYDCTEAGGEWRDVDGETEWPEFAGPKYCRVKFDFFTYKGPKPDSVDTFLCKNQCKSGTEECNISEGIPQCTCTGGVPESDWRKCFMDGNEQCASCDNPDHTPIADRKTNTVSCQKYEPYHLVDCGRDATQQMRIVPKAEVAPYSKEMCAYWVKQDADCQGDYFYTINHLDTTDFSEKVWPDYVAVKTKSLKKTMSEKEFAAFDWDGEKETFLKEWEHDFSPLTNTQKSWFMKHKQKKYGCWCRANQATDNAGMDYLRGEFKEQEETWTGFSGNTYKFNEADSDNADKTGPRSLIKPEAGCPNYNYKIGGLSGYWGCENMEPKPIWGWILAKQDGTESIASPKYYRMLQHLGDVVNLANGVYSFLCYAGEGQYKNFSPHIMSSWSQGPVGIGTSSFRHHMKVKKKEQFPVGLCNMGDPNMFTHDYNIKGEHTPAQDRTMHFVIQLWEFEDGRMYYKGTEKVPEGYAPHEDPRFNKYKEKFTVFYSDTQITRIESLLGPMVAQQKPNFTADLKGLEKLKTYLNAWLEENRSVFSILEDDTKEGIYFDDGTTNGDLLVTWYLETMEGASDPFFKCKANRAMKIHKPEEAKKKVKGCDPPPTKPRPDPLLEVFGALMPKTPTDATKAAGVRDAENVMESRM